MSDTIRICSNHSDERPTPLIFTFAFPGAEYWCPHCGYLSGMFGAGEEVPLTTELQDRARMDKEENGPAMKYLRAYSAFTCSQLKHGDKWIRPDEMPEELRAAYRTTIKEWKYPYPGARDER